MEKDYSLQCLDYAIEVTRQKPATEKHNFSSFNYIYKATELYVKQNYPNGFTSAEGARQKIMKLSSLDIEEQLLKHVIKSSSVKERKGYVQALGTNLDFSTAKTTSDAHNVMYQAMKTMHMDGIKYALSQYPQMYDLLLAHFLEERYYDKHFGPEELDQPMNSRENDYYYQKIDEYYKNLKLAQVQGKGIVR